jgi:hypothetical protein
MKLVLELPDNDTMGSANENRELVDRLLVDAKNMLKSSFSENEYREVLAIVERANKENLLGADKSHNDYLGELLNIANDILRTRNLDEVDISTVTRQPRALYVYIALVATGLISA